MNILWSEVLVISVKRDVWSCGCVSDTECLVFMHNGETSEEIGHFIEIVGARKDSLAVGWKALMK